MKHIKKFENIYNNWETNKTYLWDVKVEMCKIWNISAFGIAKPNQFHLHKREIYDYYYKNYPEKFPKNADTEYEKMKIFLTNKGFKRNNLNTDVYECDFLEQQNKYNL